ncbi:hypothetical protein [Brachybacterium sp. UNK5269]
MPRIGEGPIGARTVPADDPAAPRPARQPARRRQIIKGIATTGIAGT